MNQTTLQELSDAATKGEWRVLDHGSAIGTPEEDVAYTKDSEKAWYTPHSRENARFITELVNQYRSGQLFRGGSDE